MRISDWSSDVCSSDLFACQLLKQLDELDRAILRGARPPLGQRRLAGCQDRHDLRGNRALGHGQPLSLCSDRQAGFGAHTGGLQPRFRRRHYPSPSLLATATPRLPGLLPSRQLTPPSPPPRPLRSPTPPPPPPPPPTPPPPPP